MKKSRKMLPERQLSNKQDLYTAIKSLITQHPFLSCCLVLVCVLSFGFFATRYTYHTDSLVSEYYDGVKLIAAGRFVAPLLSFVTNWLAFSPFWQTVMMCLFLIIAGLVYAVLIKRESENKFSDEILFCFIMAFISAPLMTGQLTYPNLNIYLSFVLVPLTLWVIRPFDNKITIKRFIAGVLIMIPAIDMYESFAPVFLVSFSFLFLIRYYFGIDREKSTKEYVLFILKRGLFLVGILALAIVIDFAISKIICKLCTGTFEFWYSGNTTSHWLDTTSSFKTSLKKLLCYFIVDCTLATAEYFWSFLYVSGLVFLGFYTIIFAVKNAKKNGVVKTIFGILFFVAMFISSKSLDLILCHPAYVTQMQQIQIFTALAFLIFSFVISKFKYRCLRYAGIAVITLIILLQTQTINNYSVKNQERFDYEDNILTSVCEDLSKMDLKNKEVCFYAPEDYSLPKAFLYKSSTNPIAMSYKKVVFSIWDRTVPTFVINFFNSYFSWVGDFETAEDFLKICSRKNEASTPYLAALPGWSGEHSLTENTFSRKGLKINTVPFNKEKLDAYYKNTEFSNGEKYRIIEDENLITVIFITPMF